MSQIRKPTSFQRARKHYFVKDFLDRKDKKLFEQSIQLAGGPGDSTSMKSMRDKQATKIQTFLKQSLLSKYFSLDDRIKYFNYVQNFLKQMHPNSCLQEKDFKHDNEGYTIGDIIDLEKKIGTESRYGIVYKTSVKNMLGRFPIAAKIMSANSNNTKEVEMNMAISNKILKRKLSRHFLLSYKSFICRDPSEVPFFIANNYEYRTGVVGRDYYITLNEIAIGDLFSLCIRRVGQIQSSNYEFFKKNDLVFNVILQCLLSVATFHKLGYVHQDCHSGNFLYHMTEDTTGYYHYRILGKDYFLKNCGYTMMIYDFGLAEPYTGQTPSKYDHYNDVFNKKGTKNLYNQDDDTNRPFIYDYYDYRNMMRIFWHEYFYDSMLFKVKPFVNKVMDLSAPNKYSNEDELISNLCTLFVTECPAENMFVESLPVGEKTVNDKPYIIDDTLNNVLGKLSPVFSQGSTSSRSSSLMSVSPLSPYSLNSAGTGGTRAKKSKKAKRSL